jgi:hypothetical protein
MVLPSHYRITNYQVGLYPAFLYIVLYFLILIYYRVNLKYKSYIRLTIVEQKDKIKTTTMYNKVVVFLSAILFSKVDAFFSLLPC